MKKSTTEYYKAVLNQAKKARAIVEKAEADYQHNCVLEKELLESGMIGKEGYDTHIAEHGRRKDEVIEGALSMIDTVTNEYNGIMDDLARLDGSRIDDNVMKVLNSGMSLSSKDWQMLADENRDNAVMSRILRERYIANPPQEKNAQRVTFGQSPESRREVFNKFANLIRHTCVSGTVLREYADRESYWNYLALDSIGKMQPFSDENFDSVNEDFPVTYQTPKSDLW